MSRVDQYDVRVVVDGRDLGTWDKLTGGEIDSEELTFKPGAMGDRISLGGSVNLGNVTVSKLYNLAHVHAVVEDVAERHRLRGEDDAQQPLDVNGAAWGSSPLVYKGKLKRIAPPEHDSESNDAALLELEMTPAGTVT